MKYRIRHKKSGKWLWHIIYDYGFECELVPNKKKPYLVPTEWENIDEALSALVRTIYGTNNMEIVEIKDITI